MHTKVDLYTKVTDWISRTRIDFGLEYQDENGKMLIYLHSEIQLPIPEIESEIEIDGKLVGTVISVGFKYWVMQDNVSVDTTVILNTSEVG